MISPQLLRDALIASGIPEAMPRLFDSWYDLPDPESITKDLSAAFSDWLFKLHIKWRESQFDCNKFAKLATVIADIGWMDSREVESALAFGTFGIPGHMLCVAVHLKQPHADPSREITVEDLRVAFYEPQPSVPKGEMVFAPVAMLERTLTPDEISACTDCDFK